MRFNYAARVIQGFLVTALILNGAKATDGINPRIVGGSPVTNISDFPYHAGIVLSNSQIYCNGALIDARWVLSSASCVRRSQMRSVVLATTTNNRPWPQPSYSPSSYLMDIDSADIVLNPSYVAGGMKNDLALIKLPYAMVLTTPMIKTVAYNADATRNFSSEMATVTGFGKTGVSTVGVSDLMSINMRVMEQSACVQAASAYQADATNLCVESTGPNGPCDFDDASPLVATVNNEKVLIGIYASYPGSDNCTNTETFRIFNRVSSFSTWIAQTIATRK